MNIGINPINPWNETTTTYSYYCMCAKETTTTQAYNIAAALIDKNIVKTKDVKEFIKLVNLIKEAL